jgi:hypothetical protein
MPPQTDLGVARGHPGHHWGWREATQEPRGGPQHHPSWPCVGFLSLSISLCLSLFSVTLSSDGGDWVAVAQSEMGSTGGTWRRRTVMVVKGAVYIFMRLRFGY